MAVIRIGKRDSGRISVVVPYDPALVAKIKEIEGRRWHPEEKVWTVPDESGMVKQLLELFAGEKTEVDSSLLLTDAPVAVEPAVKLPRLAVRVVESEEGWEDHPLIGQVDQELALRGYSRRTRKNSRMQAVRFLRWLRSDPAIAGEAELRQYLQAMADSERFSASYCNQAQATLNIIYERVLHRPERVRYLPRMKEPKQLPLVLSREEIVRLLQATGNLKHRALLMVAYSAGLSVGEVVRLKISDVDAERGAIRVACGKGRKDRYTLLSQTALSPVQEYVAAYQP